MTAGQEQIKENFVVTPKGETTAFFKILGSEELVNNSKLDEKVVKNDSNPKKSNFNSTPAIAKIPCNNRTFHTHNAQDKLEKNGYGHGYAAFQEVISLGKQPNEVKEHNQPKTAKSKKLDKNRSHAPSPVSYTHLTLPTICSV